MLRHLPDDVHARIYTASELCSDGPDYLALAAFGVPIPWYGEMRMYAPPLRDFRRHLAADDIGLVHITTPGPVGLAAKHLAASLGLPTVGSFHTNLADYGRLLTGSQMLARAGHYMRWLYGACGQVLVPSGDTRDRLRAKGWHKSGGCGPGRRHAGFHPRAAIGAMRERGTCATSGGAAVRRAISREKGLAMLQPLESLPTAEHGVSTHRAGEGPMSAELRGCVRRRVLGRLAHQDMSAIMASADVFFFPATPTPRQRGPRSAGMRPAGGRLEAGGPIEQRPTA